MSPHALCVWLLLVVLEASCRAGVPQDPVLHPAIPVPALCRVTVPPFSSWSPRRPRRLPWLASVCQGPLTLLSPALTPDFLWTGYHIRRVDSTQVSVLLGQAGWWYDVI